MIIRDCPRSIFDPNERNWRIAVDSVSAPSPLQLLVRLPDGTVAALEDQHRFDMLIPKIYQGGDQRLQIDTAGLILKHSLDELEANSLAPKISMEQRTRIWRDAGFASRIVRLAIDLLASGSIRHGRLASPGDHRW